MSKKPGLYANINAKQERGGTPRKLGSKGAPTKADFVRSAKTAKTAKPVKKGK